MAENIPKLLLHIEKTLADQLHLVFSCYQSEKKKWEHEREELLQTIQSLRQRLAITLPDRNQKKAISPPEKMSTEIKTLDDLSTPPRRSKDHIDSFSLAIVDDPDDEDRGGQGKLTTRHPNRHVSPSKRQKISSPSPSSGNFESHICSVYKPPSLIHWSTGAISFTGFDAKVFKENGHKEEADDDEDVVFISSAERDHCGVHINTSRNRLQFTDSINTPQKEWSSPDSQSPEGTMKPDSLVEIWVEEVYQVEDTETKFDLRTRDPTKKSNSNKSSSPAGCRSEYGSSESRDSEASHSLLGKKEREKHPTSDPKVTGTFFSRYKSTASPETPPGFWEVWSLHTRKNPSSWSDRDGHLFFFFARE